MNHARVIRGENRTSARAPASTSRQQARTDATRRKLLARRGTNLCPRWFRGGASGRYRRPQPVTRAALSTPIFRVRKIFSSRCSSAGSDSASREVDALLARQESPAKLSARAARALRPDYPGSPPRAPLARIQALRDPPSGSARATARAPAPPARFRRRSPSPHRARHRPHAPDFIDCRCHWIQRALRRAFARTFRGSTPWFPTRTFATCSAFSSTPSSERIPRSNIRASLAMPRSSSSRPILRFCGRVVTDGCCRETQTAGSCRVHLSRLLALSRPRDSASCLPRRCSPSPSAGRFTRSPEAQLDLGLVGLWQFLPGILLFLVSGYTADRFDRRKILTVGYAGFAVCSALLLTISLRRIHSIYPIYGVVVLVGVVRCFNAPASRAILPLLVPEEQFQGAFAWGAIIFETATILGPAVGGLIYANFPQARRGVCGGDDRRGVPPRFRCSA